MLATFPTKSYSPSLKNKARAELERRRRRRHKKIKGYGDDPARFCREQLGESFTDDIIEVMESVRDNPITVAKSANGTGKTHAAARIAAWFYLAFEDAQVYTAAAPPENNLKNLLWGEMDSVIAGNPLLFTGHDHTSMNLARPKKAQTGKAIKPSFITGVTIPATGTPAQREARFSGKHAPHLLFIVDEGDAIPEEVYRGIESCMSGGFARLLVLFNPRHEAGPLYRMERDRTARIIQLTAFNHPNVVTGEDIYPGAVDRAKTVRRINEWSRPLTPDERPDGNCFEVPAFLVGCTTMRMDGQSSYPPVPAGWRKITNSAFSYMVLAEYPAQATQQLISRADIAAARSRWDAYVAQHGERPPAFTRPTMGVDVAEFGVDANATCFRYGGYVARIRTWDGLDVLESGEKAAGLYMEYNAESAQVDATGLGAGVAPVMNRNGCKAAAVKVASAPTFVAKDDEGTIIGEFRLLRDQIWWSVREWLRKDAGAMLPPDELLIEELMAPTYEVKNGYICVMDKKTMKEVLGRSPDRADALGMTFAPGKRVGRAR